MSKEPLAHKRPYTNAAVGVKSHLKLLRMEQVSWVANTWSYITLQLGCGGSQDDLRERASGVWQRGAGTIGFVPLTMWQKNKTEAQGKIN